MLISQIYHTYKIPPNLQRHMLEVASVANYVIENFREKNFDHQAVIETCLLHDMGNIIKFKEFIAEPMKLEEEYWRKVQKEFIKKYGLNAHDGTVQIIKELNLINERPIIRILDSIGFHALNHRGYEGLEDRICDFADMCVSPEGVVGFEIRMNDLVNRYRLDQDDKSIEIRKENAQKIQEHVEVNLSKIGQENLSPTIEKLKNYEFAVLG